jgi:hypothetical protein
MQRLIVGLIGFIGAMFIDSLITGEKNAKNDRNSLSGGTSGKQSGNDNKLNGDRVIVNNIFPNPRKKLKNETPPDKTDKTGKGEGEGIHPKTGKKVDTE